MKLQFIEAKLKKVEREREKLTKQLQTSRSKFFSAIPAKHGFKSIDALIHALAPYASPAIKARLGAGRPAGSKPAKSAAKRQGSTTLTKYSEAQKAAVRAAITKGGKTVPEISKDTGVGQYTIIDWKKKWGLSKKRKKTAAKKK